MRFYIVLLIFSLTSLVSYAKSNTEFFAQLYVKKQDYTEQIKSIQAFYREKISSKEELIVLIRSNSHQLYIFDDQLFESHSVACLQLMIYDFNAPYEAFFLINYLRKYMILDDGSYFRDRLLAYEAKLFQRIDRHKNAIALYDELIVEHSLKNDTNRLQENYINQGASWAKLELLDSAINCYKKAESFEQYGFGNYHIQLKNNLADLEYRKGEYAKARDILIDLVADEKCQKRPDLCGFMLNLGYYYQLTNDLEKSLTILDSAELHAQKRANLLILQSVYATKKGTFLLSGNAEYALTYQHKEDSLGNVLDIRSKHEAIEKAKIENVKLDHKLKLAEKERLLKNETELKNRFYLFSLIAFFVLLITATFSIFRRKRLKDNSEKLREKILIRDTSQIDQELLEKIKIHLIKEKLYTNKKITIDLLSKKTKSNSTSVSNVINNYYGISFRRLINDLRIKDAQMMLISDTYDNYSIEGISQLLGYKSLSSFNNNFKRIVGATPSQFQKNNKN